MNKREAQTRPQHHPQDYPSDLNPNMLAGENYGDQGPHPERDGRSAFDVKELHGQLSNLTNAELKDVQIIPEGSRLEQGATYLDLRHPERGEFVAMGGMTAGPDNYYVLKSATDYELWNRLSGVTDSERLDETSVGP